VPSRRAENEAFERTELRKRILIGVAVALGIGVLVWVGVRSSGGPLNNPYAVSMCKSYYEAARSQVDTAAVDRREPESNPDAPAPRVSCGELRANGRLQ
jgi:hypothetical protein